MANDISNSRRVQGVPAGFGDPVQVTVVDSDGAPTGGLTDAELRATPVPVSGPLTNAQFTGPTGLLSAAPYSDPTGVGDGSVIGLLKGIYVQNEQMIALLTQIETNTSA